MLASMRTAAPLRAGGDDAVVPPRGLDHLPALDDVVADRLLDVDVLARLAGEDRHERVPVIGRGNRHRIDVAVVEHAAEVGLGLGAAAVLLLDEGQRVLEVALVDVHDVRDADVRDHRQVLVVILSASAGGPGRMALVVAAQPDDRDVDGFVRARLRTAAPRIRQRQSGGGRRGPREEETTVHGGCSFLRLRIVPQPGPFGGPEFTSVDTRAAGAPVLQPGQRGSGRA